MTANTPSPADVVTAPTPAPGSTRHAAWLYSDPASRSALAALLALEQEIERSADPSLAHEVAHQRLAWWGEETQRLALGQAAHPLSRAVAQAAVHAGLSPPDLRTWPECIRLTLAQVACTNETERQSCIDLWVHAIWRPAALLSAALHRPRNTSATLEAFAMDSGRALREIELLSRAATDARLGRLPLALDALSSIKLRSEDCYAQPWPDALAALLQQRLQHCRKQLAGAAAMISASEWPALRGIAVWLVLADRQARRAQRALPLQSARYNSAAAQARDALAAWRAARRALQGREILSSQPVP